MNDPRPAGEVAHPVLRWAHRGEGTELWLRVHLPAGGVVAARAAGADGPVRMLSDPLSPGHHDLTLPIADLATRLRAPGDDAVHGLVRWTLVVDTEPLRADDDVTSSLRPIAVVVDGTPVAVRVQDEDGAAVLSVTARDPWVEVTSITGSQHTLEVTGLVQGLPGSADPGTVAAALVDRDDGSRSAVPVTIISTDPGDATHDPGTQVRLAIDLATIPAGDITRHRNVVLHLDGRDVRLAGFADDLVGKQRLVLASPYESRSAGRWWSSTLRFTDRDQLVVTTTAVRSQPPADPLSSWEREHGELVRDDPEIASGRRGGLLLRPLARILAATLAWHAARSRSTSPPPEDERGQHRIHLLLANLHAAGGTVRATANLANALAARDDTEVHLVSVYRLLRRRFVAVSPQVHARVLVDEPYLDEHPGRGPVAWVRDRLRNVPSVLMPADDPRAYRFSLYSDLQLVRWLRSIRTGTVVTTRAGLSVTAARFTRPGVRVVAQQHVPFATQTDALQRELLDSYRQVDAVCVLTRSDADLLVEPLSAAGTVVRILPNPLDELPGGPPDAPLTAKRIICGGRISPVKGTDLLLEAFARATETRPEWELRVYGSARADRLAAAQQLVRTHGLVGRAKLLPPTERFDLELAKAAICAVPSRHEAFGMVIIEALQAGIPVVAFDCPVGPGEILTHDRDGVLVPAQDVEAFATELGRLMDDETLRRRLAEAGRTRAEDFSPATVAAGFVELLETLA